MVVVFSAGVWRAYAVGCRILTLGWAGFIRACHLTLRGHQSFRMSLSMLKLFLPSPLPDGEVLGMLVDAMVLHQVRRL